MENKSSGFKIFLWLLFFFPVGIYKMWVHKKYPMAVRIIVSGFFGLVVYGAIFGERLPQQQVISQDKVEVNQRQVAEKEKIAEPQIVEPTKQMISQGNIKNRIDKLAHLYRLLQAKYKSHTTKKNDIAWASFMREFRKQIEEIRNDNTTICSGTQGCFDFNMSYTSLDMMALQAGRILYRDNYPTKDYQRYKNEFTTYFTNVGGNKLQLMAVDEKIKGKVWYVINKNTGSGYIIGHKPKLKSDEIAMSQKDMELYERFDKEIFKSEYASMTDEGMTKAIAKKWKVTTKKLDQLNIYGVTFKQALRGGKLEDKR